ncbi:MAG: protein translocase subunit SecD [bacterium]
MRNQLSRVLFVIIFVVLSVIFLYPTLEDYQFRQKLSSLSGQDSLQFFEQNEDAIRVAKDKRMKLGLDIQGGMRVVLEVDILQYLEQEAKNEDDNFKAVMAEMKSNLLSNDESLIPAFAKKFMDRGIRLSRYYGDMRDDDQKIITFLTNQSQVAIDRAEEVVRNRVDQYRVSEPNIQKQGGRRIIVELPGVKNENEVRQLLKGTAKLEFRLLRDPNISYKVMTDVNNYLKGKLPVDSTAAKTVAAQQTESKDALQQLLGTDKPAEKDTSQKAGESVENPFFQYVMTDPNQRPGDGIVEEKNRDRVTRLLARPDIQKLLPGDFQFVWSAKGDKFRDGKQYYYLYALKKTVELTGAAIENARATVSQENNLPVVQMAMNRDGSREWSRITGANINKRIAVVLDEAVFTAPVVRTKIPNGQSVIEGMDSGDEAKLIEIILNAGALPAPVSIIEQRSVGPSLGEDSIRSGVTASLLAFILTIIFMVAYYNNAGFMADIALFFNILFILGVMAAFKGTLTLPGIAGIILTIGMAVDANVLINERIREELAGGKTLRAAIDAGYKKAFAAIADSNITTFLTGIVLYQFGTGPVQGFALTLMIGIVASMISAIIITRIIFDYMTDKGWHVNLG